MNIHTEQQLIQLYETWAKENVISINPLPASGSNRDYCRIQSNRKTAIGVFNPDDKENRAFIEFSRHFRSLKLNVPEIYGVKKSEHSYLIEDLGDISLFSELTLKRHNNDFPDEITALYKQVIEQLVEFQIKGGKNLDYAVCYPRIFFDEQSMLWDLNYFKYYFLKLAKIHFDEQALEEDFHTFTNYLLKTDCDYFLYRDFQSRNIMLKNGIPYFIDYQGGRRGALQYDLASLLYDAKAAIPESVRNDLLKHYIDTVSKQIKINSDEFRRYYYGYVLIRIMQAMGAYGFRGFYEKKVHFLRSVPYAINNLKILLNSIQLPIKIPALLKALKDVVQSGALQTLATDQETFTVTVNSFSYNHGIPVDPAGHGGGFVFDCRAIHNPGRYDEYKKLTGQDRPVIEFLSKEADIQQFLENAINLIDQSVKNYIERKFTSLTVSFGCTGGQHRSVYCAEAIARHLKKAYNINVVLQHLELENKR